MKKHLKPVSAFESLTFAQISLQLCWYALWLGGLFYTGKNIVSSAIRYSSYTPKIQEKQGDADMTFPNVIVCSNSMHSQLKMKLHYPFVNENILRFVYGQVEPNRIDALTTKELKELEKLDQIPMLEFYDRTSPRYFVEHCRFNNLDCSRSWRRVSRLMGYCIELSLDCLNYFSTYLLLFETFET